VNRSICSVSRICYIPPALSIKASLCDSIALTDGPTSLQWWQIYLLDIRAAEDQGCEVTIAEDSFDTQLPLNINDADLDATATELPPPLIGLTEMTVTVLRLDVVETGRKIRIVDSGTLSSGQILSLQEKLEAIKSCERKIHHKYLQYCRPDVPIT
jgi:hypothetical protein